MLIRCAMKNRPEPDVRKWLTGIQNPVTEGIVERGDLIPEKDIQVFMLPDVPWETGLREETDDD